MSFLAREDVIGGGGGGEGVAMFAVDAVFGVLASLVGRLDDAIPGRGSEVSV